MLVWVKTSYGWEADAPYMEGSYIVQGAVGEGFVLTVFWNCVSDGGQNQMEFECPIVFKSLRTAKDWCQRDYDSECA